MKLKKEKIKENGTQSVKNTFDFKLGTKVKYTDIWGNELSSVIMTRKLKWLGNDLSNGTTTISDVVIAK